MSREKWRLTRQSKGFYTSTYHRACTLLMVSVMINLLLALIVGKVYFSRPETRFYATSGVTPPIALVAMDSPNYTSVPLLPADEGYDATVKAIPE